MALSLRRKIILVSCCAVVALSAIVGSIYSWALTRDLEQESGRTSLVLARAVARALEPYRSYPYGHSAGDAAASSDNYKAALGLVHDTLRSDPSISYLYTVYLDPLTGTLREGLDASTAMVDTVQVETPEFTFALQLSADHPVIIYGDRKYSGSFNLSMAGANLPLLLVSTPADTRLTIDKTPLLNIPNAGTRIIRTPYGTVDSAHRIVNGHMTIGHHTVPVSISFVAAGEPAIGPGAHFVDSKVMTSRLAALIHADRDYFDSSPTRTAYGRSRIAVAILHTAAGQPVGAVVIESPGSANGGLAAHVLWLSLATTVGVFLVVLLFAIPFARSLTRPIQVLLQAIQRVGDGDLTVRLTPTRHDEFGQLFEGFNFATERLLRGANMHRAQSERLRHMAYTDELTRLGNRKAYFERTEELFRGSAERGRPILHGVLFIDMDNFRAVHEYRSHAVGDSVLVEVARRIERTVKGSEFVFRISGDEFAVVLRDLNNEAEARDVARRILDEIARPYELQMGCDVIRLSASIGLSLYPSDSESAEELIRQADTALDGAKREGNSVCRFSSDIQERLRARLDMIADLRLALGREEFTLVYQPIISADGKLTGAEALLRWQSPERGTVQPMEFIPLLEETGLIVQVGRWVIETACGQAREFQNEGLEDFGLSVNLSPRQLEDFGIADRICETLKATGLRPEQLSLEITESLITEHETVLPRLEKLHETGIQVSIDDFGTGYSSLSRLSQLPIDVLKVDKSFVDQMDVDRPHSSIVGPIVNLARILGLQVIVEGVETESQLLAIRGLGCDHMQGYLFSHPLPPAAFIDYARSLTTVSGEPVAFLQTPVRTLSDEVSTR